MGLFHRALSWLESRLPKTTINILGKPYLTRCYVFGKDRAWGNIYLHHFHSSDQGDELHSHPWKWGLSLVLSGGYSEERSENPVTWRKTLLPGGRFRTPSATGYYVPVKVVRREVHAGKLNFIRSTDFHRVDLHDEQKGAWTLFFTGPRTQDWGFLERRTSEFKDWRQNPEAIA